MLSTPRLNRLLARCAMMLCLTAPSVAQTTETKPAQPAPAGEKAAASPAAHPLTAKEMREAQIAADTEKLYQLAQELKVELDKSTKDTLSLAVIRKAAEIEKLAHSISERMKTN